MESLRNINLVKSEEQTPIEVALCIDEDGRTTAKKLYEFLELDKSNYARWCKKKALCIDEDGRTTAKKLYEFLDLENIHYARWCKKNIIDNTFAEENVDFWAFTINGEWGRQSTIDYKLTASFAKKLAMSSHTKKGEQARNYFIKVEEKLKHKLPTTYKEALKQLLIQVEENEKLETEKLEIEKDKNRLEIGLDYNKQWYTVKRVATLNNINWKQIDWKKLKAKSYELGYAVHKIFDANYGHVNSYHYRVWRAVYPEYKI